LNDERLATLRFAPGALEAPMRWIYETHGGAWTDEPKDQAYGELSELETEIRTGLKADFPELKEKQVKDLLTPATWRDQRALLLKGRQLQAKLGSDPHDDFNGFDDALDSTGLKLEKAEKKQIIAAVTWKNPEAAKVVKKVHKGGKADPFYGLFAVAGKVVEYEADADLRDFENVALDPGQSVDALNEAYFEKEVLPHVPDAWIDAGKRDPKDDEVGVVGYEIPFNRHFYQYQPPRDLAEIDADLDAVSAEIMKLLQEVHS
jgi:type I restriction enzyme M protein